MFYKTTNKAVSCATLNRSPHQCHWRGPPSKGSPFKPVVLSIWWGSNSLMTMTHSINDVDLWEQPSYDFQGGQRVGSLGDKERGPQASLSLIKDWFLLHKYKRFQAESESTVSSFVEANAEIPAWAWSLPCTSVPVSESGFLRIWWGDFDYLL